MLQWISQISNSLKTRLRYMYILWSKKNCTNHSWIDCSISFAKENIFCDQEILLRTKCILLITNLKSMGQDHNSFLARSRKLGPFVSLRPRLWQTIFFMGKLPKFNGNVLHDKFNPFSNNRDEYIFKTLNWLQRAKKSFWALQSLCTK